VGIRGFLKALAAGSAWTIVALLIALGSAGIVATMNHTPGTPARAELTAAGDEEVAPALDAATSDLQALSDEVDALAGTARDALSQVVASDESALADSIATGTRRLATVQQLTDQLEASLRAVPSTGDDWALTISSAQHRRFEALASTSGVTAGLESAWASLSGRALGASRISGLLERHDEEAAAAAQSGTQGKYKDALKQLDAADATIVEARKLRDDLAATTDVEMLTAWLDRNADYDAALRSLYAALIKSNARVTDDVRKAFAREQAARAALPGDTKGIVVIMSDIAQGGLNEAVITIEQARGTLSDALDLQQQIKDGAELDLPG
jgi:hypothetical protein